MITAAQRISPSRARLWLPFDSQYRQDVGANLVVDGDMEAVGTAAYTAGNSAALTKQTLSPHSGLRYLRVAWGGVSWGYAYQSILSISVSYRIRGWFRGDGINQAHVAHGGNIVASSTSSTVWQFFDVIFTASATALRLYTSALAAGFSEFDDLSLQEAPLTTRNVGGYPGAPTYVRLGDGHTASTIPTQCTSSRGISLDGGDYARVPMDFEYNEPFSISVLTNSILPAASWLAATYDSATARGIRFGTTGSGALVAGMFDNGGRSITLTSANNTIPTPKQPRLYTMSYDGGLSAAGLTMWIDDQVVTAVGGGTALASSVSSGRDLLLGARWNAATPAEIMAASNIYCASEYDTVLDSYELRMLKQRMLKEMRV